MAHDRQRQVALAQTRQSMIRPRINYESDSEMLIEVEIRAFSPLQSFKGRSILVHPDQIVSRIANPRAAC